MELGQSRLPLHQVCRHSNERRRVQATLTSHSPSDRGTRFYSTRLVNPCGRDTDNPCINNLVCAVTFDYCLLNMMRVRRRACCYPPCIARIVTPCFATDQHRSEPRRCGSGM